MGFTAHSGEPPRKHHPLNRLLAPVEQIPLSEVESPSTNPASYDLSTPGPSVACLRGVGQPTWLTSGDWRLLARLAVAEVLGACETVASFTCSNERRVDVLRTLDENVVVVPFSLAEAYENYVSEAWRVQSSSRQLSSRQLDAFYAIKRVIPRPVQLAGRRILANWQRGAQFPAWPYDDSVASLLRFYAGCLLSAREVDQIEFRWFWPDRHHAALILTHDVETAAGLRLAVEVADLEEERGMRSSFNIVADWYPVDRGILRELCDRGFELGVHGVHHNRSMFSSRSNFDEQLPKVSAWAEEIGAVGFRSPATHRIFSWLGELPLEYDCTVPHSDPYEPIPGGACTPWPFFIGDVVELPYTLPQDHTLFTILNEDTTDIWMRQADTLQDRFGLIQCVTHPDPGYLGDARRRGYYIELLDEMRSRDRVWKALPRDVARWWRERDAGVVSDASGLGVARRAGLHIVIEPAFA